MDSEKSLGIKRSTESINDSTFQPITKELVNSLVTPPIILNPLEPMDTNASPALSPKHTPDAQMMEEQSTNPIKSSNIITSITETVNIEPNHTAVLRSPLENNKQDIPSVDLAEEMQTESFSNDFEVENSRVSQINSKPSLETSSLNSSVVNNSETITLEDILLLVDFFYLPFEYGSQGVQLLNEFQWLKTNSYLISTGRPPVNNSQHKSPEILEWYERAQKFQAMIDTIERLCTRLVKCKNLSLIYDLFPYIWDFRGTVTLLNTFVKWLCKY